MGTVEGEADLGGSSKGPLGSSEAKVTLARFPNLRGQGWGSVSHVDSMEGVPRRSDLGRGSSL